MNRDDYIPLSYIAQYGYCPRRAALLMLEQCWNENEYTAQGRAEHENVHDSRIEKRDSIIKLYETQLYSDTLKLIGKSDCIEFTQNKKGTYIQELKGCYDIYPVEYKHGKLRKEQEYNMQLCAQAICLEEMYNCKISKGAIFYISSHRRSEVIFDEQLIRETKMAAEELLRILRNELIPKPNPSPKCKKCSLMDICMPNMSISGLKYIDYIKKIATDPKEE